MKTLVLASGAVLTLGFGFARAATTVGVQQNRQHIAMGAIERPPGRPMHQPHCPCRWPGACPVGLHIGPRLTGGHERPASAGPRAIACGRRDPIGAVLP